MNTTNLKNRTEAHARILNNAKVLEVLAKYKDADWSWGTHWDYDSEAGLYTAIPKLFGYIDAGVINPDLLDLLEYATSCGSDYLHYQASMEDFRIPLGNGPALIVVQMEASQALTKDQKKTLKAIGVLVTERVNPKKPRAYNNTYLACHTR